MAQPNSGQTRLGTEKRALHGCNPVGLIPDSRVTWCGHVVGAQNPRHREQPKMDEARCTKGRDTIFIHLGETIMPRQIEVCIVTPAVNTVELLVSRPPGTRHWRPVLCWW